MYKAEYKSKLRTPQQAIEPVPDTCTVVHGLVKVTAEIETLRSSQRNRWFLSGAVVLLCGLLIGGIVGRQQKKKRSLYS